MTHTMRPKSTFLSQREQFLATSGGRGNDAVLAVVLCAAAGSFVPRSFYILSLANNGAFGGGTTGSFPSFFGMRSTKSHKRDETALKALAVHTQFNQIYADMTNQ